jgi:wyosine [tRNA(Phe)-imidazoG37] synthetase (radical SAM superfamily)
MRRTVRLTESDLARIVKRVIKENLNDRPDEMYSHINSIIDYKFSDVDPDDAIDVLEHILQSLRSKRDRGDKSITKDSVMKNWNMNEGNK